MKNLKQGLSSVVSGRNFSPTVITAMIIAIFVIANTLVYVGYSLLTAGNSTVEAEDLSITDAAKDLFTSAKSAGKKITVTFCMSESELSTHETGNYVYRTAKEFVNKYPDFIELRYANIFTLKYDDTGEGFNAEQYKSIPRKDAEGEVILDSEGNPVVDEYAINRGSVIFECTTFDGSGNVVRKNTRVLTGSDAFVDFFTLDGQGYVNSYNGEEIFTAMSGWVIADEHKTAYFTMGHGEVPSTNFYNTLLCAGFYIDDLNLRRENVPEDAALVIISNPKSDFERSSEGSSVVGELDRLNDYKKRGGSFYVVVDPIAKKLSNLEEFVADFGISFRESDEGERLMIKDLDRAIGTDGFTLVTNYAKTPLAENVYSKIAEYGGNVIIKDAAALNCDDAKGAKPLLVSSESATLEAGGQSMDNSGSYTVAAYSERYNESAEPAKMFFVPSVYLTADDAMVTNGYSNKDFIYSLFDVFYGAENMPYGTKSVLQASTMLENLTLGASLVYTAVLMAIPAVLAVLGTVIIIRRKNR